MDVAIEMGLDPGSVVIDHNNEETVQEVLDRGFWAAFTLYPETKMGSERMVEIARQYGSARIFIDSSADWGRSDPLAVPPPSSAPVNVAAFPPAFVIVTFSVRSLKSHCLPGVWKLTRPQAVYAPGFVFDPAALKLANFGFAGGTVNFATVGGRTHLLSPGEAGFEDGTVNYMAIPAVRIGLDYLAGIGTDVLSARLRCLTGWLLARLLELRHGNGRPLVRIYGPVTTAMRGPTVTMNFYDPGGHLLDYRRVEELAGDRHISVRSGCFCNPGVGEAAEGITVEDITAAVAETTDLSLPRFLQFITHRSGKSAGALRVSLGIASNFEDVRRFAAFAGELRDQTNLTIGEVTFDIASCRVIRDGS